MRMLLWFIFTMTIIQGTASAQQCPVETAAASETAGKQTLHGTLLFHDGLRQWFELKLDGPMCGQKSIELITLKSWTPIQTLRGCHVTSTGVLADSEIGYFSLDVYQDVDSITPSAKCNPQKPFPDYSKLRPALWVTQYRVDMEINYDTGDHQVKFNVTTGQHTLSPWQAYANYFFTGNFVLYGHCAKGFVTAQVFGTKQAKPSHLAEAKSPDDIAMFDPESASAEGVHDLKLGYTCVRGK